MRFRKLSLILSPVFFILSGSLSAHHEGFYPINWDESMEREISIDPFNPKYFQKYPYGFVSVGCNRAISISFGPKSSFEFDSAEFSDQVKKVKVTKNMLAFFILCNAISDIRHPPKKEIMQYKKMEKAYAEVYELSVELSLGGEANPNTFIAQAAALYVLSQKSENMFPNNGEETNPVPRTKWLVDYYNSI